MIKRLTARLDGHRLQRYRKLNTAQPLTRLSSCKHIATDSMLVKRVFRRMHSHAQLRIEQQQDKKQKARNKPTQHDNSPTPKRPSSIHTHF